MAATEQTQALRGVSWDPLVAAYLEAALGVEKFQRIKAAIGVPPLSTCLRVNTLNASTQEVLQLLHRALPEHVSNISPHPDVPVAIILKGSGPHHIDPEAAGVTQEIIISRKAGEAVLRGAQVFVPGVLAASSGLAVGDLVAVTVALDIPGTSHCGITRGTVIPQTSDDRTTTTSQPAAAAAPGSATAAGTSADIAAAGGRLCVGIGRATMSRSEIFRVSHGVAVELVQRLYDLPSPPADGRLKGRTMLQNLPSIVAALVLNPTPGSRVLDMCAAPGGKTTMLAQIMGGKGQIVALDRSHAKVDNINALATELGCSHCVQAYKADSTRSVEKLDQERQKFQQLLQQQWLDEDPWQQQQAAQHSSRKLLLLLQDAEAAEQQQQQRLQPSQQQQQEVVMPVDTSHLSAKAAARMQRRLAAMSAQGQSASEAMQAEYRFYGLGSANCPGFPPESFDNILLDAPCSALGLRPRLLQQQKLEELLETAAYQRALMYAAVQLLKPGGHLVFSTCTISPAENEVNVRHLLDTYPCLKLVPAEPHVGGFGLTGPADVQALRQAVAAAAATATAAADSAATAAVGHKAADPAVSEVITAGVNRPDTPHSKWGGADAWCSEQWLSPAEAAMVQRFDPCDPADTIGFFIAKFQKVCSC